MTDRIVELIVAERNWLSASMAVALLALAALRYSHRHSSIPARRRVLAAMNLFFGVTVGVMAFGHILAVTTKLAVGNLEGSAPAFYVIGIVLAVPSWWLVGHTRRILASDEDHGRRTLILNAWLAITFDVGEGVERERRRGRQLDPGDAAHRAGDRGRSLELHRCGRCGTKHGAGEGRGWREKVPGHRGSGSRDPSG